MDKALSQAPSYRLNDFATRDRYRRAVEAMARACDGMKIALAQAAVARALEGEDQRRRDVGYYLIAESDRVRAQCRVPCIFHRPPGPAPPGRWG